MDALRPSQEQPPIEGAMQRRNFYADYYIGFNTVVAIHHSISLRDDS